MAGTDKPSVLFVCVHNAGRSQTAAGQGVAAVRPNRDDIEQRGRKLLTELGSLFEPDPTCSSGRVPGGRP